MTNEIVAPSSAGTVAELVPVAWTAISGEPVQAVNLRDVHAFLEIGRDYTWLKDRIEQYGFSQGFDYVVFPESGENPNGGRPRAGYFGTLDMAKELAMVERNARGKAARAYFLECERRANRALSPAEVLIRQGQMMLAIETEQRRVYGRCVARQTEREGARR